MQGGRDMKLDNAIFYPLELDISDYLSRPGQDIMYDLYAIICHLGTTMSMGHYICYVKDYEDQWLCLNDSQVATFPIVIIII
jgi:ubiquitin carboxyl-terminal hydrolase 36/42